jgi:hypothetical protein
MDRFFIILMLASALLGVILGFGRVLKALTNHLPGKIAAVVFTYFIYGTVLNLGFVNSLLTSFVTMIASLDNFISKVLLIIRIDMIVFAVALFLLVRIAQKLAVSLVAKIMQAKNPVSVLVNRVGGAALSAACMFIVFLIILQFSAWTSGYDGAMYEALQGSRFGLDKLFLNNPLNAITEMARLSLLGF